MAGPPVLDIPLSLASSWWNALSPLKSHIIHRSAQTVDLSELISSTASKPSYSVLLQSLSVRVTHGDSAAIVDLTYARSASRYGAKWPDGRILAVVEPDGRQKGDGLLAEQICCTLVASGICCVGGWPLVERLLVSDHEIPLQELTRMLSAVCDVVEHPSGVEPDTVDAERVLDLKQGKERIRLRFGYAVKSGRNVRVNYAVIVHPGFLSKLWRSTASKLTDDVVRVLASLGMKRASSMAGEAGDP